MTIYVSYFKEVFLIVDVPLFATLCNMIGGFFRSRNAGQLMGVGEMLIQNCDERSQTVIWIKSIQVKYSNQRKL